MFGLINTAVLEDVGNFIRIVFITGVVLAYIFLDYFCCLRQYRSYGLPFETK